MMTFFAYWLVTGLVLTQVTAFLLTEYARLAKYFNEHCAGEYPLNPEYSSKEYALMFLAGVLAGPITVVMVGAAYLDWSSIK